MRPGNLRSWRAISPAVGLVLCVIAVFSVAGRARAAELADYVNTLQGTNSRFELTRGNTFPATTMPWGMHAWTPQTGPNGDGWKYQYHKDSIRGFQQAHQCSSWSNDYAVFSLMPVVGELVVDEERRATKFQHSDEVARPHDYSVKLASGVQVEMAPAERGALLRFSFPPQEPAHLVFDGYGGECAVQFDESTQRLTGSVRNQRGRTGGMPNYFVLEFDQRPTKVGTWRSGRRRREVGEPVISAEPQIAGRRVGAYAQFEPGTVVTVRVASSYIDQAHAELTWDREVAAHGDLESASAAAKAAWNDALGVIVVEGGTEEQRRTFYSCLFRASLFPRMFFEYDAQGQPCYRSPYDQQVHAGYMYTDTGLWDAFRAQMPLNALIRSEMHGRYMQALLAAYDQCGWLPSWSFPGEAGSMIGNHAVSLLADAWAKGIRTFDIDKAIAAYDHESSQKGPWGPANGRGGVEQYEQLGYLPYPEHREATAKTLEYAYDDFCGQQLALAAGDADLAAKFGSRIEYWKNVFDAETGFVRGRDAHGRWQEPFDPTEWGGPFTEGCAWHWNWSVFHDIAGLIDMLGGEEAFCGKLDGVFAASSDFKVGTYGAPIHEMREMVMAEMGQYAHGNQPIQHMTYLYCYAGQPWKTQYWVRQVMDRLYNSTENGYPGDEDQGQTSSWYVLSAVGLYSVCPGTDQYVIGSPLFERATLTLDSDRQFRITAKNQSAENVYIQQMQLNGEPFSRMFLRHDEIVAGGELVLEMGPKPNKKLGAHVADRPFSVSTSRNAAK